MGDSRVRLTDPFGVIYLGARTIESRQPSAVAPHFADRHSDSRPARDGQRPLGLMAGRIELVRQLDKQTRDDERRDKSGNDDEHYEPQRADAA